MPRACADGILVAQRASGSHLQRRERRLRAALTDPARQAAPTARVHRRRTTSGWPTAATRSRSVGPTRPTTPTHRRTPTRSRSTRCRPRPRSSRVRPAPHHDHLGGGELRGFVLAARWGRVSVHPLWARPREGRAERLARDLESRGLISADVGATELPVKEVDTSCRTSKSYNTFSVSAYPTRVRHNFSDCGRPLSIARCEIAEPRPAADPG